MVANGHLQVLPLGGGCGGLGVSGGDLRGSRSEWWGGGVHGRRAACLTAFRAKTSEEGVGVPEVREDEGAEVAVVLEGE